MGFTVQFAVYGCLSLGNENNMQAADVSISLQDSLNASTGVVTINNTTMGVDPCPGQGKHFGAIVVGQDGVTRYFACAEGQTVDFNHGT